MAVGDMFLKIDGSRQGGIKGESRDDKHAGEIDVVSWSWGMAAQTGLPGDDSGKSTVHELRVNKRVDSASTALMQSLRNNEILKSVVLTVRKAGSDPVEYFKIKLQNARVTGLTAESGPTETEPELSERLSFTFDKVTVEYTPQGDDGRKRGALVFETEIADA
jgi:type VI secretion system secreted protein Hcp